jgi:hypothetical protein
MADSGVYAQLAQTLPRLHTKQKYGTPRFNDEFVFLDECSSFHNFLDTSGAHQTADGKNKIGTQHEN